MNDDDPLEPLLAEKTYLEKWVSGHKAEGALLPVVAERLRDVEWQIGVLRDRPAEASQTDTHQIATFFRGEADVIAWTLPLPTEYGPQVSATVTAYNASGNAMLYGLVTRVGDLGTPAAVAYRDEKTERYKELQRAHGRPRQVRQRVLLLDNPRTVVRFDAASEAAVTAAAGAGTRVAAGVAMRTLLDGVRGDLMLLARQHPRQQKVSWQSVADKLAVGGPGSPQHDLLLAQEAESFNLRDRLTDVAKDRRRADRLRIDDLWAELLDHLNALLNLVTLS